MVLIAAKTHVGYPVEAIDPFHLRFVVFRME